MRASRPLTRRAYFGQSDRRLHEGTERVTTAYARYLETLQDLQQNLLNEGAAIEQAASTIADCIGNGGLVHVFGSGHSHMMAEEVFYRAGSLMAFNALLDINLT